jgi:hypothetical protein
MDRDDGVLPIHLAAEHRSDLTGLNVAAERLEAALEIARDVLALPRPIDKHTQVVELTTQRLGQRAVVFEPAAALQQLLCGRRILPELGVRDLGLDLAQFALQA